jgi:hypothetical protein
MKKSFPVLPAAIAGIVLLVLILIGINVFVGSTRAGANRLDLTANKIYTSPMERKRSFPSSTRR